MHKILCSIILCFVSTNYLLASHTQQPLSLDEMVQQMVAANNMYDAVFLNAAPDSNQTAVLEIQFNGLQDSKVLRNKTALIKRYQQIDPKSHVSHLDTTKIMVWVSNSEIGAQLINIYALEGDKQEKLDRYYKDVQHSLIRDNTWYQIPAKKKSSCCLVQ